MASIVGKKKGNQTYYYVVTSGRVNGKPRITHQTYLGTAERLAQLVRDKAAPIPLEATARDAGLPAALWQAAQLSCAGSSAYSTPSSAKTASGSPGRQPDNWRLLHDPPAELPSTNSGHGRRNMPPAPLVTTFLRPSA